MAAKSERHLPNSFQPKARANETPSNFLQDAPQERRKCVPSVKPSIERTALRGVRRTAASSPGGTIKRPGVKRESCGKILFRKPRSPVSPRVFLFVLFLTGTARSKRFY